jgi:PAS domain S-box-containing protein
MRPWTCAHRILSIVSFKGDVVRYTTIVVKSSVNYSKKADSAPIACEMTSNKDLSRDLVTMPIDGKQEIRERIEKRKAEKEAFKKKLSSARSEEKELRKLLRERNSFINLLPVAIIALEDDKIVEINKMVERELGYPSEEMLGCSFTDFVDPDSREAVEVIHRKKISDQSAPDQYETDLVTKEGSVLLFDVRVQKVRHAGRTLLLTRLESIHERKKEEKKRIESGKVDALMTLAAAVVASFRSPLAALVGSARSMRMKIASGVLPPEGSIERIEDAASQMTRFNEALDQYCRSAQDSAKVTPCDLREILKDVIATTERQKGTGVKFKTYLRPVSLVEADPKEMQEALVHLITNGIEAMPEGGDLYLSTEENAGHAYVFIQDSGAGIPEELQGRILDPFFTTKGNHRIGLGLSIAQAIIRRHKGTLEITSRKGHGTIASVRMPLAAQKRKDDGRVLKRKIKNARILVIEDDHMIRELLSHLLKTKGFKVLTAVSSAEGLQQLRRKAVDMVIIGSQTPDLESPVLAREIKRSHEKLPVALIVGHEAPEGGRSLGADLILTKPLDMNQVVSEVSRVLISTRRT